MDLSCNLAPGPQTVEYAQIAERLGYRRVWLYDSPALYQDVWMTLARVADATETIGLGCSVIVPSLRHVLVTASAIATLEQLAPGRAAAVIGTGFSGRRMLGQRPLAWSEVASYVRTLRGLLRGDDVEVDGKVVRMSQPRGWVAERPVSTPILIAANGPKGLAVARQLGDGVVAMVPQGGFAWSCFPTPGTVLDDGETLESPRVFDALGASIAVTYHFLYETAPDALDDLPGGAEWRAAVEEVPERVRHLAVHERHCIEPTTWELPFLSPAVGAGMLTGPPSTIRARLEELEASGVTEVVFGPGGSDVQRELRAMAAAAGLGA